MPFAPVFSITAPLAGALILLVGAFIPRLQPYKRFAALAATGLALVGVALVPLEWSRVAILYRWQPSTFFGAFPVLLTGRDVWLLALALSGAVFASGLVQAGRIAEPRHFLSISVLGMLAAGLAALWGENLLVVLIAWSCFDLAWMLGMITAGLPARRLVLGAGLNGLATLTLWVGALLVEGQKSGLSWQLMDVPLRLPLLAAGALRLGLYPFSLAFPVEEERPGLPGATPLLLGPVLGWGLLVRLAASGALVVADPWLIGLAAATFIGGGLVAWTRSGPGEGWPWTALAALGGIVWACLDAPHIAPLTLAAAGLIWTLGATLLHLGSGFKRSAVVRSAASAVGGLAFLVGPAVVSLVALAAVEDASVAPLGAGRVIIILLGQALLTAALLRRMLRSAPAEEAVGPLYTAARSAGLLLPIVLLLAGLAGLLHLVFSAGVSALLDRATWVGPVAGILWLVGAALGAVLFWGARGLRQRARVALGLLYDLFRLDWAFRVLLDSLGRATVFLGAVADMMEGPGAILWALAIFLLVLLGAIGR